MGFISVSPRPARGCAAAVPLVRRRLSQAPVVLTAAFAGNARCEHQRRRGRRKAARGHDREVAIAGGSASSRDAALGRRTALTKSKLRKTPDLPGEG